MFLISAFALVSLLLSLPAVLIFFSRLARGPQRRPPVVAKTPIPEDLGRVTIVVPTLNEVQRLSPCLEGLTRQGYEVREVLIVDSNSQDGTRELVKTAAEQDSRLKLITDPPLPPDWVGRPWALHYGFLNSSSDSEWLLGIDADTQPQPGLVAGLLEVARAEGYDLLSLSPQFILEYPGEWWLQPALLMTLLYRFDPAGADAATPERVMANGQCFLIRRSLLVSLGGYEGVKGSFCDDVTLARSAAMGGYKVGFLDGQRVLRVRMYEGFWDTWEGWGRSLDLKDASSIAQVWGDLWLLLMVQALPLPLSLFFLWSIIQGIHVLPVVLGLGLNLLLVVIRWGLLLAIAPSYYRPHSPLPIYFWLSPLADGLAVFRIFLSSLHSPQQWRGRVYGGGLVSKPND